MSKTIGEQVKEWRESRPHKVTQVALAEALGIKQGTLSGFEQGDHRLSEELALKLEAHTKGAILAEECVREDRRWIVLELKRSRQHARGAA